MRRRSVRQLLRTLTTCNILRAWIVLKVVGFKELHPEKSSSASWRRLCDQKNALDMIGLDNAVGCVPWISGDASQVLHHIKLQDMNRTQEMGE